MSASARVHEFKLSYRLWNCRHRKGMVIEMRIERVDDRTVRCFLSNEELEEYDIDYKDFVTRSEKAKEIVQEIIEQATEEVGYKPPKFAFDLQIMMVPDEGLVLTFSDKDPDVSDTGQFLECLKEMKRILQKTREATEQAASGQGKPAEEAQPDAEGAKAKKTQTEQQQNARPSEAVFVFSSLRNVMNYAAGLPGNLRVESTLYETDDFYFLHLMKGHASYERYSRACIQALEFAALYTADENRIMQLKEQASCLIPEKALKKLRG